MEKKHSKFEFLIKIEKHSEDSKEKEGSNNILIHSNKKERNDSMNIQNGSTQISSPYKKR